MSRRAHDDHPYSTHDHGPSVDQALALLPRHQREQFLAEVEKAREEERVWTEVGRMLLGYEWQLFGHLTFAFPLNSHDAVNLTAAWIRTYFSYQAYAYIAPERGSVEGRVHVHVLIGGAKHPERFLGVKLELWEHGDAEQSWLEPFKPHKGGTFYASKSVPEVGMGTFIGRPKKYRPKKRGRGRRKKGERDE